MMKSHQQQQYKYFYIDRKFSNGSLHQINDALNQIDILLPTMSKLDLINSFVIRMLDLIQHAKHFYLKHKISTIFQHHHNVFLTIHSRDEIVNVLSKCLKASDEYTRIIAINMIKSLSKLFIKDTAVYHTLLSKISSLTNFSKKQKQISIICLISIFIQSKHLVKLYTKNITEIQTLYKIPIKILIYILLNIDIDNPIKKNILQQLKILITNNKYQLKSQKQNKKERYYYNKLVIKYSYDNYHIVEYYQQKLRQEFGEISNIIDKIKRSKYVFMKNINDSYILDSSKIQKIDAFIDCLYQMKKEKNIHGITQNQKDIQRLLGQIFDNHKQYLDKSIFLLYFIQSNHDKYQQKYLQLTSHLTINKSLLKKCLTLGLFTISTQILNRIQLNQEVYLIIKHYLELQKNNNTNNLIQFKQICQILNSQLYEFLQCWQIMNNIFTIKQQANFSMQQQLDIQYNKLQLGYQNLKLKYHNKYIDELQIVCIILENKDLSQSQIKIKCYHLLPSYMLGSIEFWYVYLSKSSILRLFS